MPSFCFRCDKQLYTSDNEVFTNSCLSLSSSLITSSEGTVLLVHSPVSSLINADFSQFSSAAVPYCPCEQIRACPSMKIPIILPVLFLLSAFSDHVQIRFLNSLYIFFKIFFTFFSGNIRCYTTYFKRCSLPLVMPK